MKDVFSQYHEGLNQDEQQICCELFRIIDTELPATKGMIWHAHPVWFDNGNPLVGYSKLKGGIRLLFWSGQSFDEPLLKPEGKFKAAEFRYATFSQIIEADIKRWLQKASNIQWDYKNIVKRKGELLPLKGC